MKKTVIMIEGRRDCYSADDIIESTITVGNLIALLEEYSEDTPVMINNDNGYTYGEIHGYTIEETEVEIDDEDYDDNEED